jgi:hypothetical protein
MSSVAHANLIDLTPGGFTISPTGEGIPPAYTHAISQLHFDTALSPVFGRGPWLFASDGGLGGQYLFSNLFDVSSTANALISWNLAGQPDGDWLTAVVLFGSEANGTGIYNVYGVRSGERFQSGSETVTLDGSATIYGIAFYGLNPSVPTPEGGNTLGLLISACFSLVGLKVSLRRFSAKPVGVGAASQAVVDRGVQAKSGRSTNGHFLSKGNLSARIG